MSDPNLDKLRLAFALSIAQEIVDADNKLDYGELKLWGQIFPRPLLRDMGFIDGDDNFTDAFETTRVEAVKTLPARLSDSEKLDLLTLFHGTSMADDELEERELAVLRKGADLLGISPSDFTAHIAELTMQQELGLDT